MDAREATNDINEFVRFAYQAARRYGRIGTYEPEDIAQNAMLRLLKRTGNRPPTKGWLYKVVRSAAYDACRAHSRDLRNLGLAKNHCDLQSVCERADEDGYVRVRTTYVATQDEPDVDLLPRLQAVLIQLSEPLREVLVLSAQGFTYQQISERTQVSIGTVRSRLFHARKRAQLLLNDLA